MHFALRIACLAMLGAAPSPGLAPPSPLAWSPDGKWLSFCSTVSPPRGCGSGWIFPADSDRANDRPADPEPVTAYRIWSVRPETNESLLLEESRGPLTAPAWSRDGSSIAFGRIVREPSGTRFETVVQDAPDRKRILLSEPLSGNGPAPESVQALAPQFRPDGQYLVTSRLSSPGLVILRIDTGKVVKTIDGARSPRWSPEDGRLAFIKLGREGGLFVVERPTSDPKRLGDVSPESDRLPAPIWSRDGQTIATLRRVAPPAARLAPAGRPNPPAAPSGPEGLSLLRIRVDTGGVEPAVDLVHDLIGPPGEFLGAWFAPAAEGDDLFYSTATVGQSAAQIVWCKSRANEVYKKFPSFDQSCPAGALAPNPAGGMLAVRYLTREGWSGPALCDPDRVVLITPDADLRADWRIRLAGIVSGLIREKVSLAVLVKGKAVERPSVLPAVSEFEPGDPFASRLRRLAKLGLPLCDPASSNDDETRLGFAMLLDDRNTALSALDRLQSEATDADRRLRLMAIRAQVMIAGRDFVGVAPLVDYLRKESRTPRIEIDEGLGRSMLTPLPDPRADWVVFLENVIDTVKKAPPTPTIDPMSREGRDVEAEDEPGPALNRPGQPF